MAKGLAGYIRDLYSVGRDTVPAGAWIDSLCSTSCQLCSAHPSHILRATISKCQEAGSKQLTNANAVCNSRLRIMYPRPLIKLYKRIAITRSYNKDRGTEHRSGTICQTLYLSLHEWVQSNSLPVINNCPGYAEVLSIVNSTRPPNKRSQCDGQINPQRRAINLNSKDVARHLPKITTYSAGLNPVQVVEISWPVTNYHVHVLKDINWYITIMQYSLYSL